MFFKMFLPIELSNFSFGSNFATPSHNTNVTYTNIIVQLYVTLEDFIRVKVRVNVQLLSSWGGGGGY